MARSQAGPDVLKYGQRDFGLRVGIWRLMEIFDKYGVRPTIALNAKVCQAYPQIIQAGVAGHWDWIGQGLSNQQPLAGLSEEQERSIISQTIELISAATGRDLKGWLGPDLAETVNTPDLLAEAGLSYTCDWCNDEQPYPIPVRNGKLISMPYSMEVNDVLVWGSKGQSGEDFFDLIRDQFDILYRDGERSGRVMSISLHPHLAGQAFRSKWVEKALDYITGHQYVWCTTATEIASWYYQHYYRQALEASSESGR
jgi:peptidoglycan/xylan/chitin deacetylase (PgdA/CDA1 family)